MLIKLKKQVTEDMIYKGNNPVLFFSSDSEFQRIGGRGPLEPSKWHFEEVNVTGVDLQKTIRATSTEGSDVIINCSFHPSQSYENEPTQGTFKTDLKMQFGAAPEFYNRHFKDSFETETARVLDKIVRSSGFFDLNNLIINGETYGLKVSIVVLRYAGGIYSAVTEAIVRGMRGLQPLVLESGIESNFLVDEFAPTSYQFFGLRGKSLFLEPSLVEEVFSRFQIIFGIINTESGLQVSGLQLLHGDCTEEDLTSIIENIKILYYNNN